MFGNVSLSFELTVSNLPGYSVRCLYLLLSLTVYNSCKHVTTGLDFLVFCFFDLILRKILNFTGHPSLFEIEIKMAGNIESPHTTANISK